VSLTIDDERAVTVSGLGRLVEDELSSNSEEMTDRAVRPSTT
jgi:hypothetical protein